MLVQFTDHELRETWINPIHVKLIRTWRGTLGKKKGTEVWFSFNGGSEAVYLDAEPSAVAQQLNDAMPLVMLPPSDEEPGSTPRPATT